MSNKHLIIDFETFGTDVNKCAVIDMSAMVFDFDKFISSSPYDLDSISETKKFKFDVKHQVNEYGFELEADTLEWWGKQGKEVRKNISPKPIDITIDTFTTEFLEFLIPHGKISRWWSRSNSFDPPILWRLFETVGKLNKCHEHLPHYLLRDTRTWIDAKLDFPKKNGFSLPPTVHPDWESKFKAHDSAWDILADVLRMQFMERFEKLD